MLLRQFEYLVALAREKHFARAAASLNVSQPSLSAGIRQLEQELGVLVVERGHRFTGFTPEGERVLERARRILAECGMLRSDVAEFREGLAGSVRIGVIPTALSVVGQITSRFTRRFPAVTMTVLSRSSIDIQRGLDDFDLDAAITYLDNEPLERVRPKPLYGETYCFLTQKDGPFQSRSAVSWSEAADVPLCLLTSDMQNRRIIDSVFRSIGRKPQTAFETNSFVSLCAQVAVGALSSIVPAQMLGAIGLPDTVAAHPLIEPDVSRLVGLVIPQREPLAALVEALFAQAEAPAAAPMSRFNTPDRDF